MFLRNAWYVAAWGDEITESLQEVILLNEHICMFRDSKGKLIALENACPHRKMPLTKGRRKGDAVECGYHGLTFGFLVGEILQRITGKKFSDLVQKEIAKPLGLDGLFIGAPEHELSRAAQLLFPEATRRLSQGKLSGKLETGFSGIGRMMRHMGVESDITSIFDALAPRGISDFDFGSPESLRVAIPAANGLFTARSLAKMYAVLANGGELEGVKLLSQDTLRTATTLQKPTGKLAVIPFDMCWRLGYHGVATTRGFPREAFGHFGFGGSGAWADPVQRLSVALIVNSGLGSPFGDLRTARIGGAALVSARARRGPAGLRQAPLAATASG